jgi:hypothetical protein
MTIRGSTRNAVARQAHLPENDALTLKQRDSQVIENQAELARTVQ